MLKSPATVVNLIKENKDKWKHKEDLIIILMYTYDVQYHRNNIDTVCHFIYSLLQ